MIKILMIEDDLELAEILTEFLAKSDMDVTTAEEPYIGLSTLNVEKFDLVILDLTLPGLDATTYPSSSQARATISPTR